MRAAELRQLEEDLEAQGLWVAARHTVCATCDRTTVTDRDRECRRCAFQSFNQFAATFAPEEQAA